MKYIWYIWPLKTHLEIQNKWLMYCLAFLWSQQFCTDTGNCVNINSDKLFSWSRLPSISSIFILLNARILAAEKIFRLSEIRIRADEDWECSWFPVVALEAITTHSNRKRNQVNKLEKCLTSVREMLRWIEGNISRLMEIKIRTDENFECSLPSVVALEANDPFKWKTQPESFT